MNASPVTALKDIRWKAVLSRDRSQDGAFVFAVISTGIFCRPSCPARRPLPQNVRFFETASQAENCGFRACLRCKPLLSGAESNSMRELCAYIRSNCATGDPLTLDVLAGRAGLSPGHLQRIFKSAVGVTPKQYIESCRMTALKSHLRDGQSVTEATYASGFGSSSQVYERVDTRLGMRPTAYRKGGASICISHVSIDSPFGRLMIAATDRGLCFVQFGSSDEALFNELRTEFPAATLERFDAPYPAQFHLWVESLQKYLAGQPANLDLPLDVRGTAFQSKVWRFLQSIPPGDILSYSKVAEEIGHPQAVRAVGSACAANRVAIVVPCHRVLRGDGSLGGYRWGLERKRQLLAHEKELVRTAAE